MEAVLVAEGFPSMLLDPTLDVHDVSPLSPWMCTVVHRLTQESNIAIGKSPHIVKMPYF